MADDAARGHPPRHRDHRRRAAQRRLLHPRARPAAGRQDRQPGRPVRLPPVLRRRAAAAPARTSRSSSTRARPPAAPAPGMVHRSSRASARPRRSTSGRSAWATRAWRPSATATRCASPTPRGWSTSSWCARTATSRWPPSIRRSRPSTRCRASTACAPTAPTPERSRALLERVLGARPAGDAAGSCAASAAAGRSPTTSAPAEPRPPERRHRAPRRLGHDRRRAPALAGPPDRTRRRATRRHRPPLLPLDLLPRAERRAVRDRRRRPRLHGRRPARGARVEVSCRRSSSRTARRSRRG